MYRFLTRIFTPETVHKFETKSSHGLVVDLIAWSQGLSIAATADKTGIACFTIQVNGGSHNSSRVLHKIILRNGRLIVDNKEVK